jgi:hypothetical protein
MIYDKSKEPDEVGRIYIPAADLLLTLRYAVIKDKMLFLEPMFISLIQLSIIYWPKLKACL